MSLLTLGRMNTSSGESGITISDDVMAHALSGEMNRAVNHSLPSGTWVKKRSRRDWRLEQL